MSKRKKLNNKITKKTNNLSQKTNLSNKKKKRLRKDRVLLVIVFIIALIFIFNVTKTFIYNQIIYNKISNSKSNTAVLKSKNNTIKLYKRTIDYINKNKKIASINNKDITIYMDAKYLKNNINLNINTYIGNIDNSNFNFSKALYIDSNNVIKKSNKIKVKLPNFLQKNNVVDVYGIDNDGNIDVINKGLEIKNKSIAFKLSKKYTKYFITYIKVTDFDMSSKIEVLQNQVLNFKIKYTPTTTTTKEVTYDNIGDAFVIRNGKLVSKKIGEYKITLNAKNSNIKKNVTIVVMENKPKIEEKDGITYVNDILIVNKTYNLPKDYDPGSLREETLNAYKKMKNAALKDNIKLWIASGYRSYDTQDELYNYYVKIDGKDKADTYSARPGYSEHQTGFAMDLNIVDSSFEGTPEAIWLENNSYKYGFIIRYPKDKEDITGYKYEPWHVRYLGENLAKEVYDSGLTLEEYLNIDSKYSE